MYPATDPSSSGTRWNLTPLGTNGFFPSGDRQTMSFLLLGARRPVLLDAGTGLGRLLDPELGAPLRESGEVEILLTHYHLDHVVGLSFLPAFFRTGRVVIHAPTPPLVDGDPSALERLVSPPLFPVPLSDLVGELEIRPYSIDGLEVAGIPVRVRRQRHAGGSAGVVLGERLAYLTDCEADEASADFAQGCATLIHEVWTTEEEVADGAPRHGHSTVEEVAAVARESGVEVLVPVHHHPGRTVDDVERFRLQLAEASGVEVISAVEGFAISLA